jgi:hypothetical protein
MSQTMKFTRPVRFVPSQVSAFSDATPHTSCSLEHSSGVASEKALTLIGNTPDQVILERHVSEGLAMRRLILRIGGLVDGFSEL